MPSPDVGSAIGRTGVDAADETKGTPRGQPTNRVSSDASASGACTCARQGGGKEADETSSCHRPLLLDRATGYGATATIRRRRAKTSAAARRGHLCPRLRPRLRPHKGALSPGPRSCPAPSLGPCEHRRGPHDNSADFGVRAYTRGGPAGISPTRDPAPCVSRNVPTCLPLQ